MPEYVFSFAGREGETRVEAFGDIVAARTGAVRFLGAYLTEHPDYVDTGHWRIDVTNTMGQALFHVIVATVTDRNAPEDG
jgi:hypothetical protein